MTSLRTAVRETSFNPDVELFLSKNSKNSQSQVFMIISASKKMYDLLGPGRTERWFYWKYRSREQVSYPAKMEEFKSLKFLIFFVCLFVCLNVCFFVCMFVSLFVCMFVCLFVCFREVSLFVFEECFLPGEETFSQVHNSI